MEYYCQGKKIRHLRHYVQNLLGVKVYTSYKISKFSQLFGATKNHVGKIFGIWFFLSEKTRLQILPGKNQVGPTSYPYTNVTIKFLIKMENSQKKQDKNETLHFLGSRNSLLLEIGSSSFQASYCSMEWCRLTKNQSLIYFRKSVIVTSNYQKM